MARQVVITDDITGDPGAETETFMIRGVTYAIDLTQDGSDEMVELLQPFIDAGRKQSGKATPPRSASAVDAHLDHGKHTAEEREEVAAWMEKHSIKPVTRGRVPVDIWTAWRANNTALLRPGRMQIEGEKVAEIEGDAPTQLQIESATPATHNARRRRPPAAQQKAS